MWVLQRDMFSHNLTKHHFPPGLSASRETDQNILHPSSGWRWLSCGQAYHTLEKESLALENFCKLLTSLGVVKEKGKVWLLNTAPQNFFGKPIFCYDVHWVLTDPDAWMQPPFCCYNKRDKMEEWKHRTLKFDLDSTSTELALMLLFDVRMSYSNWVLQDYCEY